MTKCENCKKGITPTRPGVECSGCERPFHLTLECSSLATKQREALSANKNLEWTCQQCAGAVPRRRRLSTIVSGDEDIELTQATAALATTIDGKKLLRDMNTILKKVMKRELNSITKSLDLSSNKQKKYLEGVKAMKSTIQELKKNSSMPSNKYNNLQTRVEALEQRVQEMEQEKLTNMIDIYNLPVNEREDLKNLVLTIAEKLQVVASIVDVKRFPDGKDRAGKIQVTLEEEAMKNEWLLRAKDVKITVADVLPTAPGDKASELVYISEALTPYNKALLRSARRQLKEPGLFKYVWCKGGVIRARKGEDGDTAVIRVEDDIKQLISK